MEIPESGVQPSGAMEATFHTGLKWIGSPFPAALGRSQGWGKCEKVHIGVNGSLVSGMGGSKVSLYWVLTGEGPPSALRKPHG